MFFFKDDKLYINSVTEANNRATDLQELGVHFPSSIRNATKNDDINIAVTVYNCSTLFPIHEFLPDTVVVSTIISASVGGIPDGTVLPENVTMNFTITVK